MRRRLHLPSSLRPSPLSSMAGTLYKLQLRRSQPEPQFTNATSVDPPQVSIANALPPTYVHMTGISPEGRGAERCEPRRQRSKEQEFVEGSQISSVDFVQAGGSVSTGLGLLLDNRRVVLPSSSGDSSLVLASIDDDIGREIQQQEAELDRLINLQGKRLKKQILEKIKAKQIQTLDSVKEKFLKRIREKEAEIEAMNRKNMALEEQMKQLSVQVAAWQHRAKHNENMIAALKSNLQQVYAPGKDNNREGHGDSEVDDCASRCDGGAIKLQLSCRENKDMKELMTCKACRTNEMCMLLLPCRHLCLCKECESKLSFCPLCQRSKLFGTEIYM